MARRQDHRGQVYNLAPGDVLWIPAGIPHQVRVPTGSAIEYLVFKFNATPH
jgi:quercetin dioxygenase-like cupin family protein